MSCSCSRSWTQLAICFALLALCCPAALAEETPIATTAAAAAAPKDDDLAGPVVRASIDRVKDALSKANLTGDGAEKKKTIAQIIDEALEQEFPEEKPESIGKNYNETAKQEDVRVSCWNLVLSRKCMGMYPAVAVPKGCWPVSIEHIE